MNKARFVGIDLCRGLAAFAVILVHSGDETWGIPISDRAIQFRYLFYFAVPFFLAASFYFTTKKSPNISKVFWQKKFKRIVVPYLLWSIFYLVSKSIVFLATNNPGGVQDLLSDPVAIIFLGAASYHLYFMPLLFVGILWLYSVNYFTKQSITWLYSWVILSLIIYQLLLWSNNSFDLGTYTAFADLRPLIQSDSWIYPVWRIALVNIAWLIRCFPYFLISVLLNKLLKQYNSRWLYQKQTILLIFLLFLLINIIGRNYLPDAISEITIAYSLLLLGISSSKYLTDNNLITSLGLCSFGIYLIHPFIKSGVEIALVKLLPQFSQSVSITSMLVYSISTFLISWVVVSLILKNKRLSQYI